MTTSCSKCSEESVALFGYSEWKPPPNIPVCYLHLKELHEVSIESKSTINITISHDTYEKIKSTFKKYRDNVDMKYAFGKSYETDNIMHHEWHGIEDFVSIDYIYDKSKKSKEVSGVTDAIIQYTFSKKSTIAGLIYAMFLQIDKNTNIQSNEKSTIIEIVDNKELLKSNFLSSINTCFYSEDFITSTLRCIDTGILNQIYSLHILPFSSVSHYGTKGIISKEEDTEKKDADT